MAVSFGGCEIPPSPEWPTPGRRIMLPETGTGFFPDFVVCVDGRKKPDEIALADTKERIAAEDALVPEPSIVNMGRRWIFT